MMIGKGIPAQKYNSKFKVCVCVCGVCRGLINWEFTLTKLHCAIDMLYHAERLQLQCWNIMQDCKQ